MADEHMIGAEEDDVQFMRTVIHYENIFCKSSSVSSFLGRSSMLKLCACVRCQTYGLVGRSLRKPHVFFGRYIK